MKNIHCEKGHDAYKTYSFVGSWLTPLFLATSSELDLFWLSLLIFPFALVLIVLCKVISPVSKTVTTILCAIIVFFTLGYILCSLLLGMFLSSCQGMPG